MSGVQFRVGYNDHRVVEDFLTGDPEGVAGILVEAKHVDRHSNVIEAAHAVDRTVRIEPLTERLAAEGFSTKGLEYGYAVIDPELDLATATARDELVSSVIAPQVEAASTLTPAHFFVEDEATLDLNLDLVRRTRRSYSTTDLQPILSVQRTLIDQQGVAELIAQRYLQAGVSHIELRLSPLGTEDDGPVKIRSALSILDRIRSTGLAVTLGEQGTLGETALALGLAEGYSLGVGMREHCDTKTALSRQRREAQRQQARPPRAPRPGVHIPRASVTVSPEVGKELYQQAEIRTKLICRLGSCAEGIDRPATQAKPHYLHSRSDTAASILQQPQRWRGTLQADRLVEAIDLRATINKHLPPDANPLKTRALEVLANELGGGASAAA